MTRILPLILVASAISAGGVAARVETLKFGGSGLNWTDHNLVLSGLSTTGNRLAPVEVDSTKNLLPGIGGTAVTSVTSAAEEGSIMGDLTDGDFATGWRVYVHANGAELEIDLKGIYYLRRIRLLRGSDPDDPNWKAFERYVDLASLSLRGYELFVSNGSNNRGPDPVYTLFASEPNHSAVELDLQFPAQPIRYLKFRSVGDQNFFLMGDMEVYGIGVTRRARFVSEVLDLTEPANFGPLQVHSRIDPAARVSLRTKSGSAADDSLFFLPTGIAGQVDEITRDEVPKGQLLSFRSFSVVNNRDWSPWSPSYPYLEGPFDSPDARQWVQFDLNFSSNGVSDRAVVDSVTFQYSVPAIADSVVGEISPAEAVLGDTTAFTYYLRSVLSSRQPGFDTVFITTPFEAQATEVRIDGTPVEFDSIWIAASNQLAVVFEDDRVNSSGQRVEVDFESLLTVAGTEFRGQVGDSQSDGFPQHVVAGDANEAVAGDALVVKAGVEDPLIARVRLSSPVLTPNGDGTNDAVSLEYILLKATNHVRTRAAVHDLAGRKVREIYDNRDLSGPNTVTWDGRDDGEDLVPPGLYLLRVEVETDEGDETLVRPIGVAY